MPGGYDGQFGKRKETVEENKGGDDEKFGHEFRGRRIASWPLL